MRVVSLNAGHTKPGMYFVNTTRVCFNANGHTTKCFCFYYTCQVQNAQNISTNVMKYMLLFLSSLHWISSVVWIKCIDTTWWNKKLIIEPNYYEVVAVVGPSVRYGCAIVLPYTGINHCNDVIMGVITSQITSLATVYSIVYSDVDQRKHQSSVSLAFVRGIHRGPVNYPHKWPVTRKMFPFDDVIMQSCVTMAWPLTCVFLSFDFYPVHFTYVWDARSKKHWYTRGICDKAVEHVVIWHNILFLYFQQA